MDLFDVVKSIFKKEDEWKKVGRNDKVKNFFMIYRIMSIQFPVVAHQFNHTKISTRSVVDWWHSNFVNKFSKPPGWIFTSTKKKEEKEKKEKKADFTRVEAFVMKRFEVSRRDLDDLQKFYPEKYLEWIKVIEEQLGPQSIKDDI
jgi:hypothetical protein